jgi:hypothetical protein
MLLAHPWLRDAKVFHDWGNNTITIQGTGTFRTILVTKKLGAPTKHLEVLVCYDFHFGIFDEEEDLIFAIKPKLFLIGTMVVLTSIWLNQIIKLTTSTDLNLVEHVYVLIELVSMLFVLFDIPIELVLVLLI